MRIVVDVSVMVRAIRSPGPARRFFRIAPLRHTLLYHHEQLLELLDVAYRPRLQFDSAAVREFVERLVRYGVSIEADLDGINDCRDPKDNYVLALATVAKAEIVISVTLYPIAAAFWGRGGNRPVRR